MDIKTRLTNEFCSDLNTQHDLTNSQIREILNSLIIRLNNYEVSEKSNELLVVENNDITILKQFILSKELEGRTKNTLDRYWFINSMMLTYINKPIDKITTFDLRNYLIYYKNRNIDKQVSNRTLSGMRSCICSFFKWCYKQDIIQKDISCALEPIKFEDIIREPFSIIELEQLRNACYNLRNRALLEFMLATGCRANEIISINQTDVDFVRRTVKVLGKGNKERMVYLSEICISYLQQYLNSRTDSNISLFVTLKSPFVRLTVRGLEEIIADIGKKANVSNVHPHRFRRTCLTNLYRHGMQLADVSKIAGHSNCNTTLLYVSSTQEDIQYQYNKCIR